MTRLTIVLAAWACFATVLSASSWAEVAKTRNFYAFSDRILTAGQPNDKTLRNASKDGVQVVINLVSSSESIFNPKEGDILRAQGIEYIHLPVSWRNPDPADLAKFLKEMKRVDGKKVLIHCWANARASAFAYAHQVSKAPDKQGDEWNRLRKVWKTVAGYNLDQDKVWQSYLKKNIGPIN